MIPDRHKKKAAIVAICVACIAPAEGLRRYVYYDQVGIPTYCFGETKDAHVGDTFTTEQCKALLADRVEKDFIPGVENCIKRPMPDKRKAGFVSMAYNVGVETFCKSSVARKYNAGDTQGACDAMLLYVKAGGVTLPGLVKRRKQERELCLA